MDEKEVKILIRNVPADLHRAFKVKCAAEGVSQQAQIVKLMAEYVWRAK
jgi:plasmid stability protein